MRRIWSSYSNILEYAVGIHSRFEVRKVPTFPRRFRQSDRRVLRRGLRLWVIRRAHQRPSRIQAGQTAEPSQSRSAALARDIRRKASRLGHRCRSKQAGEPRRRPQLSEPVAKEAAEEGRERQPRPARKTGLNAMTSRKDAGVAWARLFAALRGSDSSTDRGSAAAIERWVKERSVTRELDMRPIERALEPTRDIERTR